MSVIAKITPDIKDYEKALAKIQRDTIAAGRNMGKGFGSAGNAVDALGKKVGKTGALVSGLGSELGVSFGALGRVISAVASGPIRASVLEQSNHTLSRLRKDLSVSHT